MYINEIPMTHQDKVKMYEKLTKAEIIEMLIESQRVVSMILPTVQPYPFTQPQPWVPYNPEPPYEVYCGDTHTGGACQHEWISIGHQANGHQECRKCGAHKPY